MKTGILCAMNSEAAILLENMVNRTDYQAAGQCFSTGTLCGQPAVVAVCGIGKINAALATSLLIERFGADCVINSGIAGGMRPDCPPLSVVLCETVLCHDVDRALMARYYPFRAEFHSDKALLDRARAACKKLELPFAAGTAATGDQLIANKAVKHRIIDDCAPHCVDMESAAVGQVCHSFGIPFLVIRTMSDTGEEGFETINHFEERAANLSAGILLEMLNK